MKRCFTSRRTVEVIVSHDEIEAELLAKVQTCADRYRRASGSDRESGFREYRLALKLFSNFVLHGEPPHGAISGIRNQPLQSRT